MLSGLGNQALSALIVIFFSVQCAYFARYYPQQCTPVGLCLEKIKLHTASWMFIMDLPGLVMNHLLQGSVHLSDLATLVDLKVLSLSDLHHIYLELCRYLSVN